MSFPMSPLASQNTCSICLEYVNKNEQTVQGIQKRKITFWGPDALKSSRGPVATKCRHVFHEICLQRWLLTSALKPANGTCPECRAVIVKPTLKDRLLAQRLSITLNTPVDPDPKQKLLSQLLAKLGENQLSKLDLKKRLEAFMLGKTDDSLQSLSEETKRVAKLISDILLTLFGKSKV